MSDVPEMLRLLAAEDALAQAEQENVEPPYDPGLQAELEEHGPAALRDYGQIVVRGTAEERRYNSALWYAHAHDLAWANRPDADCVILTWHDGQEPHEPEPR